MLNIEEAIKEELKKHNHNGINSKKVSASNIEFENNDCKNTKSNKIGQAIKDIDSTLINVKEKFEGAVSGVLLTYDNSSNLICSNVKLTEISKKNHQHPEYMYKVSDLLNDDIVIFKNGNLISSNININEIEKIKKVLSKMNKITVDKNNILIADENGNIISSGLDVNNIAINNHTHNDKINICRGKDSLPLLSGSGHLTNSGVTLKDIVMKKELSNKIAGKDGAIVVRGENGDLESSSLTEADFAKRNHIHEFSAITGLNLSKLVMKDSEIKQYIKDIIKETLKDIFK